MFKSKQIYFIFLVFAFFNTNIHCSDFNTNIHCSENQVKEVFSNIQNSINELDAYQVALKSLAKAHVIIGLLNQLPTVSMPQNRKIDLNNPADIIAKLQSLEQYKRLTFCMELSPRQIQETGTFTNFLLTLTPYEPTQLTCSDHDFPPRQEAFELRKQALQTECPFQKRDLRTGKKIKNKSL